MNLLECCREINKIKVILVATSDKCYENNEKKISILMKTIASVAMILIALLKHVLK